MGSEVDKHPRGVESMQRAHSMYLQRSVHKVQMFQVLDGVTPLCKCKYVNSINNS